MESENLYSENSVDFSRSEVVDSIQTFQTEETGTIDFSHMDIERGKLNNVLNDPFLPANNCISPSTDMFQNSADQNNEKEQPSSDETTDSAPDASYNDPDVAEIGQILSTHSADGLPTKRKQKLTPRSEGIFGKVARKRVPKYKLELKKDLPKKELKSIVKAKKSKEYRDKEKETKATVFKENTALRDENSELKVKLKIAKEMQVEQENKLKAAMEKIAKLKHDNRMLEKFKQICKRNQKQPW